MKTSFEKITDIEKIIFFMQKFNEHENIPFKQEEAKEALVTLLENENFGEAFSIIAMMP